MALDDRPNQQPGLVPINMTPLIDIALVLVVALLVMSSLGLESGFQVRAQAAAASADAIATNLAPVTVTILSSTDVKVDDRVVHRSQLRPVLTAMLCQHADATVTVRCDDRVTHAVFVDVLDQAKLSGAGAIAIAAMDGR